MFKIFLAFIGVAALALTGAIFLVIWISGQTPIQVSESFTLRATPPDADELVQHGAALLIHGEVVSIHESEWNTADGSRPNTPWEVSSVPDSYWIWTPVTLDLSGEPVVLQPDEVPDSGIGAESDELRFLVRGGEINGDRYEIESGEDREFEAGEEVVLVLTRTEDGLASEPGWELMRKYAVHPDGTAVLAWDDDRYEQPVDDVIEEFAVASQ